MYQFKGKGLKTEKGALQRIAKYSKNCVASHFFVASQNGEYFPVCVINATDSHHMLHLASKGITVFGVVGR